MAYTPTEWETGDVITAEKLNKMESGIAANSAGMIIPTFTPVSAVEASCDVSLSDLLNAITSGTGGLIAFLPIQGEPVQILNLVAYNADSGSEYASYRVVNVAETSIQVNQIAYESTGITIESYTYIGEGGGN